jgi:hypothetical protein
MSDLGVKPTRINRVVARSLPSFFVFISFTVFLSNFPSPLVSSSRIISSFRTHPYIISCSRYYVRCKHVSLSLTYIYISTSHWGLSLPARFLCFTVYSQVTSKSSSKFQGQVFLHPVSVTPTPKPASVLPLFDPYFYFENFFFEVLYCHSFFLHTHRHIKSSKETTFTITTPKVFFFLLCRRRKN